MAKLNKINVALCVIARWNSTNRSNRVIFICNMSKVSSGVDVHFKPTSHVCASASIFRCQLGVLDYHTEDLLRREDFILSTRFARMNPTECFFVFRLERRRRGMTDRWQCESTCFLTKLRSRSLLEYTSASVHSIFLIFLEYLLLGNRASPICVSVTCRSSPQPTLIHMV